MTQPNRYVLLVLKEAHGPRHILTTTAALHATVLEVVLDRYAQGLYLDLRHVEDLQHEPTALAQDAEMQRALDGDGAAALKLLKLRQDYQYEGLEIIYPELGGIYEPV